MTALIIVLSTLAVLVIYIGVNIAMYNKKKGAHH